MEKLMTLSDNYMLDVIDVNVKTEDAQILTDVTFSTTSGHILAILGPTGSGKTTLMNSISGRQSTVSGHVLFNQRPFSEQTRRRLGYVLQQDVFFSNLTCWETLYFTTMIRIPDKVSLTDKLSILNEIVDLLDLRDCLHTVMGDLFTKGMSGGEKKRTGIACELLTNPDILLMDEPTSGLDSYAAQSLVTKMKQLAAYSNKMVIISIHQPSSRLYQMFDSILLMAHGQVVYFGKAHDDPLEFFRQFGHVCEPNFNPADFYNLMQQREDMKDKKFQELAQSIFVPERDQMAKEEETKKPYRLKRGPEVRKKTEEGWSSKLSLIRKGSYETIFGVDDISADIQKTTTNEKWPTGFWTQFKMLTWRSFRQTRGRFLNRYDVIFYAITAIVESAVFFQTKSNNYSIRDKIGLMFHTVTFWTFQATSTCMLTIPTERGVISKENSAGAYRLSAYYLAKTACDFPLQIIIPTLFFSLVYWVSELDGVPEFFITLAILLFAITTAQGLGLFLGYVCIEQRIAYLANTTVILTGILFSGFITATYPSWLSWAKYISIIKYPLSSMSIVLFQDLENIPCNTTSVTEFPQCLRNGTDFVTSSDILANAGADLPLYSYLLIEAVMFIGFRVAAYVALCSRHVVTV